MTKVYGNCEILARDKGYYILMSENNSKDNDNGL